MIGAPLPQVFLRLRNRIVRISLNVGLLNRVAGKARDSIVVAGLAGQIRNKNVLCPGEQEIDHGNRHSSVSIQVHFASP